MLISEADELSYYPNSVSSDPPVITLGQITPKEVIGMVRIKGGKIHYLKKKNCLIALVNVRTHNFSIIIKFFSSIVFYIITMTMDIATLKKLCFTILLYI